MDSSLNSAPPPDPTVSRVMRPVEGAYWERLAIPGQEELIDDLGSAMLGGTDIVVIWSADPEVAEPEVHEPKFVFNPLEGLSRDTFPKGTDLTADARLYARAFVETLATGLANTYKKGTEGERTVESVIKDDDGNVTHLVVSRMVGTEATGKKKETSTLPVTELEESIARASDKTRFVIEPRTSRVKAPKASPVSGAVSPTGPSAEIRSDLLPSQSAPDQKEMTEAEKAEAIASHMSYLESIADLKHLGSPGDDNWRHLLSGEIKEVSNTLKVHAEGKKAIAMAGAKFDTKAISFGGAIDTGHDTREYERSNPANRFKFYSSFSDATRATEYIAEVVRLASDRRVTLSLKAFDHDYDGMNIYTNHFQEMLEIVQEVYPKFVDTFGDTEHFLQGPVDGVNPKHIGWVQEANVSPRSHSGRMEIIGSVLDEKGFSTESYIEGCRLAGVKPETPWLYDDTMMTTVQDLVDQKYAGIE